MRNQIAKLFLAVMLFPALAQAGGIVTNTNQSASFLRKPAQDAVIDATGTYYNPAGLAFLSDGFHFSLSNQTISQTRSISSTFPNMATTDFEGSVFAPLFPTVYAVYKTGGLALSLGVNPIGGGGSADFKNGLPAFEQQVAVLPGMLTAAGIATSNYSMNAAFDGSSLNWGIQVNGSYAINEFLSFSAGIRYVIATNTYKGSLSNIMINPNQPGFGANYDGNNMVLATDFFSDGQATLTALNQGALSYASALQQFIDGNLGTVQLADAGAYGLSAEQIGQIQGIIAAAGQDPNVNLITAQYILNSAAPGFAENAAQMQGFGQSVADKELDAKQSGSGISPIVGMNIKFSDDLNFAVKYEHKASITLTNTTTIDDVGMFPDGQEVAADMPSMLAMGLDYKALPDLRLSGGFHYYFDKSADYGKALPNDEIIDNNYWEAALGLEYSLSNSFIVSAGYLRTQTGVNDKYHSDLSHSLNTNSVGAGVKYLINRNLALNLGVMNTMYEGYTKTFEASGFNYNENYERSALSIGIGVDFSF